MRYCAKCAEVTPQDRHVFDGFEQIDEALNGAHTAERIVSVCERQRERQLREENRRARVAWHSSGLLPRGHDMPHSR